MKALVAHSLLLMNLLNFCWLLLFLSPLYFYTTYFVTKLESQLFIYRLCVTIKVGFTYFCRNNSEVLIYFPGIMTFINFKKIQEWFEKTVRWKPLVLIEVILVDRTSLHQISIKLFIATRLAFV